MRLYCKACNNELTGTLIPAAPEQAYSKELTDPEFDKEAGELRYYSHALPSAIMAESCGDDVERMPIIVIYEFEQ